MNGQIVLTWTNFLSAEFSFSGLSCLAIPGLPLPFPNKDQGICSCRCSQEALGYYDYRLKVTVSEDRPDWKWMWARIGQTESDCELRIGQTESDDASEDRPVWNSLNVTAVAIIMIHHEDRPVWTWLLQPLL